MEIRNAGLVGTDYYKILETHGIAHVYNHWSYMPAPYTAIVGELPEMLWDPVSIVRQAITGNRRAY